MSDEGGRGWDGDGCACEGVRPGVVGGHGRADGAGEDDGDEGGRDGRAPMARRAGSRSGRSLWRARVGVVWSWEGGSGCVESGPKGRRASEGEDQMNGGVQDKAWRGHDHGLGLGRASGGLYRGNAVGEAECQDGLDFTPHALAGNAIWGLLAATKRQP